MMNKHLFSLVTLATTSITLIAGCTTQVEHEQSAAEVTQPATKPKVKSQAQTVSSDKSAKPEASNQEDVEAIEVSGFKGSLHKQMNNKRFSEGVSDSIYSEDVGKSTDKNIADALSRVTGVTVQRESRERSQIVVQGANAAASQAEASLLKEKQEVASKRSRAPQQVSLFSGPPQEVEPVQPMVQPVLEPRYQTTPQQIFKKYGVNPTLETQNSPISTFSMDVDTASYKLAADMLNRGRLPNVAGIRIEEFINSLDYGYNPSKEIFGISAQVFPSPHRDGYHVLHLGVQTKQLKDHQRNPSNLVLVADTSGSMQGGNLTLLKEGFITLVSQLSDHDSVSIISYNRSADIVLPATKVFNKSKIIEVINSLSAGGGTNAAAGISLAYQQAEKMYMPGFNNRVILTSDGMANIGSTSPGGILDQINKSKDKGIFLTTVGVGQGNYNDHLLEQLANQGNGNYLYLGNTKDIQNNFVDGLTQSLQTVAKDAKVQVTFNQQAVSSYRLLGYENRALKTQDFTDPNKDGGEIGAGHSVTVLYEVQLSNNYSKHNLAQVAVAYKKPMGHEVNTMTKSIPNTVVVDHIDKSSPDSVLSIAAASFAEKLRQTYWSRGYQYQEIDELLNGLPLNYRQQDQVIVLKRLIKQAQQIDTRNDSFETQYPIAQMNFQRVPLLD